MKHQQHARRSFVLFGTKFWKFREESKGGTVPADQLLSRLAEGLLLKSFSPSCHWGLHPHMGD